MEGRQEEKEGWDEEEEDRMDDEPTQLLPLKNGFLVVTCGGSPFLSHSTSGGRCTPGESSLLSSVPSSFWFLSLSHREATDFKKKKNSQAGIY